jgi:hypothetical protein
MQASRLDARGLQDSQRDPRAFPVQDYQRYTHHASDGGIARMQTKAK